MRIITVVGTRPEILRLMPWETEVIFTEQHFDYDMGGQFIDNIQDNQPKKIIHYLSGDVDVSNVGPVIHAIRSLFKKIGKPDIVLVHGDTRSALSGALAAQVESILIAHTESGVRCYYDTIEESYRKKIDSIANYNFCPIPQAVDNLKKEGIVDGVYFVGDTLYDSFLRNRNSWDFVFCTIHRRENIENKERLTSLIDNLKKYSQVIFPIHPHTAKKIEEFDIEIPINVIIKTPLNHIETLKYITDSSLVITDSGGIEREAYWLGTPCNVLRPNTEWKEATGLFGHGDAGDKIQMILESKKAYRLT